MYSLTDTRTALALARHHQDDIKASFPRKRRRFHQEPSTPAVIAAPARIDVAAMSIPAPREPERESTAA
jgi:hypothetical protein